MIISLGATPLFCDFKWLSIKAAVAHHPIIQKGGGWAVSQGGYLNIN